MQVSKELQAELLKQQGVLQKQKEELAKQLEVATSELGAIEILLGTKGVVDKHQENTKFPIVYSSDMTQQQAIYAALYRINSGNTDDITKELMSLDKKRFSDEVKTLKLVTDKASVLSRKGIIGGKRNGKKNKYFIKGVHAV